MDDTAFDLAGAAEKLQSMLAGEEGQQQLQNLLQAFGGGPREPGPGPGPAANPSPDDLHMMLKLQRAMALLKDQQNSSQAQLLLALKPFLKPARREKVDTAMKLLGLRRVLELLREP